MKMNIKRLFLLFPVLLGMGMTSLQAQSTGVKIHKVKSGDTLYGIALKYKIKLKDLRTLNPKIKGDRIYPNNEIVVSITDNGSDSDFIASSGLPRRASSPEWEDGHIDSLRPKPKRREVIFNKEEGDMTASKMIKDAFQDGTTTHTVQPGEDIYFIARLYHISPKKIMERNPGKKIKAGTQLTIPLTKGTDLVALSDEIKVRKLQPRHEKLTNNPKLLSERGKFELVRRDNEEKIYYAYHYSFPIGQKIFIQIPNNSGYVEATVIGRLPSSSDSMIGISPRIYEILKASGKSNMLTIYFEP
ncbi:MAG: LysM peptidoglycan-binding domain-containing protein [Bacteroidia bacterium]|nr:LysM peptidoglycan-binding domain-containing protein [Bacteroidia bacterium]